MDGVPIPLDGALSHQSKLHTCFITGQRYKEKKTRQNSATTAFDHVVLTSSSCVGLTISGHVHKIRKISSLSTEKINYSSWLTWQGNGFPCPVEDIRVWTHILNVSKSRKESSNYSALNGSQMEIWGCCELGTMYLHLQARSVVHFLSTCSQLFLFAKTNSRVHNLASHIP